MSEIPVGLCQCGCRQPTSRSTQSRRAHGYRKGDVCRYLPGHHCRPPQKPTSSRRRKAWARSVRERAGNRCERCGYAGPKRLHAHHINGDKTDHRLENGICLCASCHLKLHYSGMNIHHTWTRSPEELREIALKAVETRRRNQQGLDA